MLPQTQADRLAVVFLVVSTVAFAAIWTWALFVGKASLQNLPKDQRPHVATYWLVGLLVGLGIWWLHCAGGLERVWLLFLP